MTEEQSQQSNTLMHQAWNNTGVIEKRLNTEEIVAHIEYYLSGKRDVVVGNKIKSVSDGKERVNKAGFQSIMSRMRTLFNSQVVQGNLTTDRYEQFIQEVHESLAIDLMRNLNEWQINEDEYNSIVDCIMELVQLFLSRTIDNKERDSYGNMKVQEVSSIQQRSGLGLFGNRQNQ